MKIQTLSLVAGTKVCNAACPFCVSKMTGFRELGSKPAEINIRNLRKALRLAEIGGVTTAIITGKGEPTLYPEHINTYLDEINRSDKPIPLIELQTNGEILSKDTFRGMNTSDLMKKWYDLGLTTVLLSIVSHKEEFNKKIYTPGRDYFNLEQAIAKIQRTGLKVRTTVVGIKDGIDTIEELDSFMAFVKNCGVRQVTWRPVAKIISDISENHTKDWIKVNGISDETISSIYSHVLKNGTILSKLVHGGQIFDYKGQNLCLTNCLTNDPADETIRQLIFFPDGRIETDWQFSGAVIV